MSNNYYSKLFERQKRTSELSHLVYYLHLFICFQFPYTINLYFLNLGYIFDSTFINSKFRKSNAQLFRIRWIRKFLIFLAHKILVTNLVPSVFNYCSILLSDLPAYKIKPLESILRSAKLKLYILSHIVKRIMT